MYHSLSFISHLSYVEVGSSINSGPSVDKYIVNKNGYTIVYEGVMKSLMAVIVNFIDCPRN